MKEAFIGWGGLSLVLCGCMSGAWGCYIYNESLGFVAGGFLAVCLGFWVLSALSTPDSDDQAPLCKACGQAVAGSDEEPTPREAYDGRRDINCIVGGLRIGGLQHDKTATIVVGDTAYTMTMKFDPPLPADLFGGRKPCGFSASVVSYPVGQDERLKALGETA